MPKLTLDADSAIPDGALFAVHPLIETEQGDTVFAGDSVLVDGQGARRAVRRPELVTVV
jgi:hypothetical protein